VIRDQLLAALHAALDAAGFPTPPAGVELTTPNDPLHGDFTTNVALQLAKPLGMPPRDVAAKIVVELERARPPHLERVEIAGPGFLNLHLAPTWLHEVLLAVAAAGEGYGHGHALDGLRINLEFVSANPTGPLHAGGGRWVAVGDALANLLASQGAIVHREYYLNDAGNQLDTFAASLIARYRGEAPPEDGYQGQYVIDMAERMRGELGDEVTEEQARSGVPGRGAGPRILRALRHFDTCPPNTLHEAGDVGRADDLRARGVVFDEGAAAWLRATLATSDRAAGGSPTAPNLSLQRHRTTAKLSAVELSTSKADHHGQVKSLQAGIEALGAYEPEVPPASWQLVRHGEQVHLEAHRQRSRPTS
jgi:arginyl-tRNA synthetase